MEKMTLETPKRFEDNTYLGMSQRIIEPAQEDIDRMGKAFENSAVKKGESAARCAHPELRKDGAEIEEAKAIGEAPEWLKKEVRVIPDKARS